MTPIIKYLLIVLLVVFISSCDRENRFEEIEELVIFGSSGFYLKDNNGNSYSSTYWIDCDSCSTKDLEHDSTKLDIRQYFEFKKGYPVKTAIRKPGSTTEYCLLSKQDTLGLKSLINSTLLYKMYKDDYQPLEPIIYDGWAYTLYFKTSNGKEKVINYIPSYLPDSLKILHDLLREITLKQDKVASSGFEYHQIVKDESIKKYVSNPPHVLNREVIKFPLAK
jgi:hypothetical protein